MKGRLSHGQGIGMLLMVMVLLMSGQVEACKHAKKLNGNGVVQVFVMDSTNALIGGANVVLDGQKDTIKTSWDGRFAFVQMAATTKMKIAADGFKTRSISVTLSGNDTTMLVRLEHDPKARPYVETHHRMSGRKYASSDMVLYSKAMPTSRADAAMAAGEMLHEVVEVVVMDDVAGGMPMPTPSAGLLTAGEVNDFAKWGLWDSVIHGSHQQYVKHWQMCLEQRYVVQVVNKDGYPMVNQQVSMVSANGETLFQARTDNTGRAELWANLTRRECDENAMKMRTRHTYVQVGEKKQEARAFFTSAQSGWQGMNTFVLDEACDAPATADVFFIMDATGSMGDELRYMQAELKDVMARSQSAVDGLTIRTGALVYRDHGDDYLTRISRLSEDVGTTQAFLDKQRAMGGGDYEEAIPEALMATLNAAGWNDEARTRIAFLILDAPCHNDSATLALLHEQVLSAAAMGVRLVPVVCSGLREAGELLARSMALATNGTSFFLTDDSGIGNSHLKPTTDSLKVEHLNDMLVRTIIEFCRMPDCDQTAWEEDVQDYDPIEAFLPNPTDDQNDPAAPVVEVDAVLTVKPNPCQDHFVAVLKQDAEKMYLIDMTGKTILSLGSQSAGELTVQVSGLSTGVYFVKVYAQGRWLTQKLIIRG